MSDIPIQQPPAVVITANLPASDINIMPSQEIQIGSCIIDLKYYYELQNKLVSEVAVSTSSPYSEKFAQYGLRFFLAKSSESSINISDSDLENVHKAITAFDTTMPESMRNALIDKYQRSGLNIIIVDDVSEQVNMINESIDLGSDSTTVNECMESYRNEGKVPDTEPRIIILKLSTLLQGLNEDSQNSSIAVDSIFEEMQHTAQSALGDYSKLSYLYPSDARNIVFEIPAQIVGYYIDAGSQKNNLSVFDSTNLKQIRQRDNYEGGNENNGFETYTFIGGVERYGFGSLLGEGLLRMGVPMENIVNIDPSFISMLSSLDPSSVSERDVMKLLEPSILDTIPQNIQPWGSQVTSLNEILATCLINGWDKIDGWNWCAEYADARLSQGSKTLNGQNAAYFFEGKTIYTGDYYGEQFDSVLLPITVEQDISYTVQSTQSATIYITYPNGEKLKQQIDPLNKYVLNFTAGTRIIIGINNNDLGNEDFGDQIAFKLYEGSSDDQAILVPITEEPGQYTLLDNTASITLGEMLFDDVNTQFFQNNDLTLNNIHTSFFKLSFSSPDEAIGFFNTLGVSENGGYFLDTPDGKLFFAAKIDGDNVLLAIPYGNNLNSQGFSDLIANYKELTTVAPFTLPNLVIPRIVINGLYYELAG